jgi:hypothetical protein
MAPMGALATAGFLLQIPVRGGDACEEAPAEEVCAARGRVCERPGQSGEGEGRLEAGGAACRAGAGRDRSVADMMMNWIAAPLNRRLPDRTGWLRTTRYPCGAASA